MESGIPIEKLRTHIPGFDHITHGGLPRGRTTLVSGTAGCAKTVLAVHSPVSIVLSQANEDMEERAAPVNSDPYGAGWMVRGRPVAWESECQRLVDPAAYRTHILKQEPEAEFS